MSEDIGLQDFWESFLGKRLWGFHLMELMRFWEAKWTLSFLSRIDSSVASQPLRGSQSIHYFFGDLLQGPKVLPVKASTVFVAVDKLVVKQRNDVQAKDSDSAQSNICRDAGCATVDELALKSSNSIWRLEGLVDHGLP
ncbi:hypothetical protein GOP47_0001512 [Adiantum capillus-veneris]|uniref:Uncharacterized protein n=1 Tax=Adiantum capillus-veneris TaxID=13818 RepID=A0A9D4V935_ADICA|nr:hypothetical protein GOP47_0001512 [Adiantum capillus-veneris]